MSSEEKSAEQLSESDKLTMSHYILLGMLTLLNLLNIVDRQLLSSFANYIVPDLNLSNSQFGLLTGLMFMVFYSFMALIMGALADIYNRPRLISAAVFLWSICTAASGAAKGFVSLAIPRMLIGVGESTLSPAAISMLADKFPVVKTWFRLRLLLYGCLRGFWCKPARRWLFRPGNRLAQLFLSAWWTRYPALHRGFIYYRCTQTTGQRFKR